MSALSPLEVKTLCADECRAQCCERGDLGITVSTREMRVLQGFADDRGQRVKFINRHPATRLPGSRVEWLWVRAGRCPFLTSDRLCGIHADKPLACRNFPPTRIEWCALSKQLFHDKETS